MGSNRRKPKKYTSLFFVLCLLVFGLAKEVKSKENSVTVAVEGTTSVTALEKLGALVVPAKSIDQAYEKLLKEEVIALVYDSPTILYYARSKGAGRVSVVGALFDIQYYGFLFPQGSELREPVNRALLKLRKNGIYDKLYGKWFGS